MPCISISSFYLLQILVLINVTPDQSMLDEGTAREIINRVQKLRKKAHLVPTDLITVYYNISPAGELSRVAKELNNFIINVLKVPFIDGPPVGNVIIEETQTVIMNYYLYFILENRFSDLYVIQIFY